MNMSKKILVLIIAVLSLAACTKDQGEETIPEPDTLQTKPRIRFEYGIATYNIRVVTVSDEPNNTWASRKALVADIIDKNDFDIFGTQEGHGSQLKDIIAFLPRYAYIGISDQNDSLKQHQAIFYKKHMFQILDGGNFWLAPGTPASPPSIKQWDAAYLPTVVSWGKFNDKENGFQFYLFNAHFDPNGTVAKLESARLILIKIAQIAGNSPVILMGDLNTDQLSEPYAILKNSELFEDAYDKAGIKYSSSPTFNNWNINPTGNSRIDHVFVTSHFQVKSHTVLTNNYNKKLPSDHFPVLIELSRP